MACLRQAAALVFTHAMAAAIPCLRRCFVFIRPLHSTMLCLRSCVVFAHALATKAVCLTCEHPQAAALPSASKTPCLNPYATFIPLSPPCRRCPLFYGLPSPMSCLTYPPASPGLCLHLCPAFAHALFSLFLRLPSILCLHPCCVFANAVSSIILRLPRTLCLASCSVFTHPPACLLCSAFTQSLPLLMLQLPQDLLLPIRLSFIQVPPPSLLCLHPCCVAHPAFALPPCSRDISARALSRFKLRTCPASIPAVPPSFL